MVNQLQESALEASITAEYEDRLSETLSLHPDLTPLVASVRVVTDMIRKERERFLADRRCANDAM